MLQGPGFQLGGASHLAAAASILVIAGSLIVAARRRSASLRIVDRILAAIMILVYPAEVLIAASLGQSTLENSLPFHLCDLAGFCAAGALLTRNQILTELTYLWGLAGTMQGVVTPALRYDFPHPEYFRFFTLHCGIISIALYLVIGRRQWPLPGAPLRALLWGIVYMGVASGVNLLLRTNYGFLMRKPDGASLLDAFGTYYQAILPVIAFVFFLALYAPFWAARQLHARRLTNSDS